MKKTSDMAPRCIVGIASYSNNLQFKVGFVTSKRCINIVCLVWAPSSTQHVSSNGAFCYPIWHGWYLLYGDWRFSRWRRLWPWLPVVLVAWRSPNNFQCTVGFDTIKKNINFVFGIPATYFWMANCIFHVKSCRNLCHIIIHIHVPHISKSNYIVSLCKYYHIQQTFNHGHRLYICELFKFISVY